jgi:DNA repair exonuclease SbcCD nuclease subunit
MVLLSGNLFHENKPSCNTMQVVSFVSDYCSECGNGGDGCKMHQNHLSSMLFIYISLPSHALTNITTHPKTMEILRWYCMGGGSVGFQIISDQKECLRSLITGRANFEDENYSVNLPIFTIHGNHDNPTRDGGSDLLSAVDLLAISNLVNYFGWQDKADNVRVSPILLQKGDTRVALYGMGSMRDYRLNHLWHGKRYVLHL